jgi:hypothetical protein
LNNAVQLVLWIIEFAAACGLRRAPTIASGNRLEQPPLRRRHTARGRLVGRSDASQR